MNKCTIYEMINIMNMTLAKVKKTIFFFFLISALFVIYGITAIGCIFITEAKASTPLTRLSNIYNMTTKPIAATIEPKKPATIISQRFGFIVFVGNNGA